MILCHLRIFLYLVTTMIFVQGQSGDLCSEVTCNSRGDCVPNQQYSRGYWCQCEEGWTGQDCLFPEPTVSCGDDQIAVVIDRGLVRELGLDDNAQFVYFGKSSASPQCRAREENNIYRLVIRSPFSSCGTQVTQRSVGDDYTFSNTVVWNRETNNQNDLIERELTLLDFKCIYEDSYTTSGPPLSPEMNILHLVTERGRFDVRMRLFEDNSYSPAREYSESPTITIGTYVYVQVELELATDQHLVVTIDRCFASQSPDPADPISTKHILIVNRCINSNDTTVQIRSNGESQESQFKFQMFKWRWSADDVYLHCEVDICNSSSELCTGEESDCRGSGSFRKKREVRTFEGEYDPSFVPHTGHIISEGPIHVEIEELNGRKGFETGDDADVDSAVVTIGAVIGTVLFALGVIFGVFYRRKKRAKKEAEKRRARDRSKRQLSSLRFTTESF